MQFTLRQLMIFVTLVCVLCSSTAWGGFVGALYFFSLVSLGFLFVAMRAHRKRHAKLAAVALIISLLMLLLMGQESVGSGGSTLQPLTFMVLADADGMPIPNARVRVREIREREGPLTPVKATPAGESGVEGYSDAKGQITLIYRYPKSTHETLFTRESKAYFPWHFVQVSADDYDPVLLSLRDLFAGGVDTKAFPLPAVKITLKPPAFVGQQPQSPASPRQPDG